MNLNEIYTDLALAIAGNLIIITYTLLMFFVKKLDFLLQFSPEFGIVAQFVSFPYYDLGGGASLII